MPHSEFSKIWSKYTENYNIIKRKIWYNK
jgi:hypothetical protein